MVEPVTPAEGLSVVHLFCRRTERSDDEAISAAVQKVEAADVQVVPVAVVGHKAELCFMALHADLWLLRDLQTGLTGAGLDVVFANMHRRGLKGAKEKWPHRKYLLNRLELAAIVATDGKPFKR